MRFVIFKKNVNKSTSATYVFISGFVALKIQKYNFCRLGTGKLRNETKRNETKRKQNPTKSVK